GPGGRGGGKEPAGQLDGRRGRAAGLEAVRRDVAAAAGQPVDRDGGDGAGEREPGKRPPDRLRREAELSGQVVVDPDLEQVDDLEEAPRRGRDHEADERGDHEQRPVRPAADQRIRVVWEGVRGVRAHAAQMRAYALTLAVVA